MSRHVAAALLVLVAGIVVFKGGGGDSDSLKDQKLPAEKMDPDMLVETISHGQAVDIEDYLVTGRWTVVEFVADW